MLESWIADFVDRTGRGFQLSAIDSLRPCPHPPPRVAGPQAERQNHGVVPRLTKAAVEHGRRLIDARQYVLKSDWGWVQRRAPSRSGLRLRAAATLRLCAAPHTVQPH